LRKPARRRRNLLTRKMGGRSMRTRGKRKRRVVMNLEWNRKGERRRKEIGRKIGRLK
jgi:hypothetical protein